MAEDPRRTTVKHKNFVGEAMGDKPLTHIPGIGPITEKELNRIDIYEAKDLYKTFVSYKRKKKEFIQFLLDVCPGCNASEIHDALKKWGEQHDPQPSTSSGERLVCSKSRAQEAKRDLSSTAFLREILKLIQHYLEESKDGQADAASASHHSCDMLPDL